MIGRLACGGCSVERDMKRIFWEGVMVDQWMIESLTDLVLTQ